MPSINPDSAWTVQVRYPIWYKENIMRTFLSLLPLLFLGCTPNVEEEECWWCSDDSDTNDTDTDGIDTDGKDTDGKDTDGKDTDGTDTTAGWSGAVDPDSGLGTFDYSGEDCQLSYAIEEAKSTEACEACAFAWIMTLGEVTVEAGSDCKGLQDYAGADISYGHQDPDALMGAKSGSWAEAGDSYLKSEMWYFQLY